MIGKLDRRITLQTYTSTRSEFGESTPSYATLVIVWAWVRFGSGQERMLADKNTVTADAIFTIRWRTGITEKTRIVWDGVNYDIIHIAEAERRKYLALTAKKTE